MGFQFGTMAAPKKVDYERIEAGWRAGLKSPAQLAYEYTEETGVPVSRAAIIKHFDKLGVPRNLDAKVHAKADAMVTQAMVTGKVSPDTTRRDSSIVEAAATEVATVRLSHRTDIQRSKRLANSLLEHLESIGLPKLPEVKGETEKQTQRTLSMAILKDQSAILDKLVGTQKVLVAMEREAFGIAQMVESPETPKDMVNLMDVARRIAFGLAKAGAQLTQ